MFFDLPGHTRDHPGTHHKGNPIIMTHVVVGVHQEVERARLFQKRQKRNAASDLTDDILDLLSNSLLGLPRLLGAVAV